jgi:hypothetical protein
MDDIIFDMILLGLVFWAGYTWGKHTAVMRIIASIAEDPEQLGRAIDQFRRGRQRPDRSADQIEVIVEWHEDQCYIYRKDTREFLGQGKDIASAVDNIDQRGITGDFIIPKEMATQPREIQP